MIIDLRCAALVLMTSVLPNTAAAQDDNDGWRTLEIETTEVTAPDVAITPDGQTLIFTLLGHLFRLPVEGGEAEQLTFPTAGISAFCASNQRRPMMVRATCTPLLTLFEQPAHFK